MGCPLSYEKRQISDMFKENEHPIDDKIDSTCINNLTTSSYTKMLKVFVQYRKIEKDKSKNKKEHNIKTEERELVSEAQYDDATVFLFSTSKDRVYARLKNFPENKLLSLHKWTHIYTHRDKNCYMKLGIVLEPKLEYVTDGQVIYDKCSYTNDKY